MLKRVGKRANGLESSDKERENLRDCAYFSTIFDNFPTRLDTFFGAGQEKVCLGCIRLQVLLEDRYLTSRVCALVCGCELLGK